MKYTDIFGRYKTPESWKEKVLEPEKYLDKKRISKSEIKINRNFVPAICITACVSICAAVFYFAFPKNVLQNSSAGSSYPQTEYSSFEKDTSSAADSSKSENKVDIGIENSSKAEENFILGYIISKEDDGFIMLDSNNHFIKVKSKFDTITESIRETAVGSKVRPYYNETFESKENGYILNGIYADKLQVYDTDTVNADFLSPDYLFGIDSIAVSIIEPDGGSYLKKEKFTEMTAWLDKVMLGRKVSENLPKEDESLLILAATQKEQFLTARVFKNYNNSGKNYAEINGQTFEMDNETTDMIDNLNSKENLIKENYEQ